MPAHDRTNEGGRAPVTTYARLASGPCPPIADLLLALVAALGHADAPEALEQLDDHARALFGLSALAPADAAERLVEVLVDGLGYRCDREGSPSAWLLDAVVRERRGHPALVAVVGHEMARRAGVRADILSAADGWYVRLGRAGDVVFVTFDGASSVAAPDRLRRHCAHELAFVVLSGLERAYRRQGDRAGAQRASGLRGLLPVADSA